MSFTGGTGRHIAHIAADKMMPVSLELGGKSPTIVFEDAGLDHAVNGVLYSIFSSSGESASPARACSSRARCTRPSQRLAAGAARLRVATRPTSAPRWAR